MKAIIFNIIITNLKLIFRLEPRLAKLEVTEDAGTVSDRWIPLVWVGGLPSNVAERWTEDLNKTGVSVGIGVSDWKIVSVVGGFGGGITGCSKAPRGSFSVTGVLGDTLCNNKIKWTANSKWLWLLKLWNQNTNKYLNYLDGDDLDPSSGSSWKVRLRAQLFLMDWSLSRMHASFAKLSDLANIRRLSDGLSGGVRLIDRERSFGMILVFSSFKSIPDICDILIMHFF